MRFACLLPAALLATGCGVPSVTFTDAGGPRDATRDAPLDGPSEAPSGDGEADGESDASAEGGDAGDAATDAPVYCKGDAGPPMGSGYKCDCGQIGTVCSGNCTAQQCVACGVCTWPSVCCPTMGNMGHCSGADGGC